MHACAVSAHWTPRRLRAEKCPPGLAALHPRPRFGWAEMAFRLRTGEARAGEASVWNTGSFSDFRPRLRGYLPELWTQQQPLPSAQGLLPISQWCPCIVTQSQVSGGDTAMLSRRSPREPRERPGTLLSHRTPGSSEGAPPVMSTLEITVPETKQNPCSLSPTATSSEASLPGGDALAHHVGVCTAAPIPSKPPAGSPLAPAPSRGGGSIPPGQAGQGHEASPWDLQMTLHLRSAKGRVDPGPRCSRPFAAGESVYV